MSVSALDIGAILILVLPGFLSYRSALARRLDPTRRSALWQLSEILEYSVYVHLLGIALTFGMTGLLKWWFDIDTHLSEIPGTRPDDFLEDYFTEGVLLFTLYPLYVMMAAVAMGAYSVPTWFANRIVRVIGTTTQCLVKIKGLRWVKPPGPAYPAEPIWYSAFHAEGDGSVQILPTVIVIMKSGDLYYGYVSSYPILPDSQKEKDFLITQSVYVPKGHGNEPIRLVDQEGGGTVLLNAADVDSIQIYYVDPSDQDTAES